MLPPTIALLALLAAAALPGPAPAQPPDQTPPAHPLRQEVPQDGPQVRTTASGLRVSTLRPGQGAGHPKPGDRVVFHYTGWLPDGRIFETSRTRGEPLTQVLGVRMPKAWVEALAAMSPGEKLKAIAPPDLGFGSIGSKGQPPQVPPVPPDTTLTFEFELIGFQAAVELPAFVLPDLTRQQSTPLGVRYEVLEPGSDRQPRAGERFELRFTLFNDRAQILGTSRIPGQQPIRGTVGKKPYEPLFVGEILPLMTEGRRILAVVPPELAYADQYRGYLLPPGSTTHWQLELDRLLPPLEPLPVPRFRELARRETVVTAAGLRYEVIESGEGEAPAATDRVRVHYAGWLTDGTLFDNSFEKGEPLTLEVQAAIPGWTAGLQLMRPGAIFRFAVPARLAYGLHGRPDLGVGPNRNLYYYVHLIEVLSE